MNKNTGFTLIEVLIAMLVLAVGLLGLAGLQVTSLNNNQRAYFRSQATQLAYDMADRMRTNITLGNYNNQAATNDDCKAAACTPAQMAGYDLKQWNDQLAAQLPSGQGIVCLDSTPVDVSSKAVPNCDGLGSAYAIKIWWDDDRSGAAAQRFVMSFQL
jgi:type IV pilus assembly protein PilV